MRLVVIALILILLVLQYKLWQEYRAVRDLRELVAEQVAENERLRTRNESLAAEVEDLRSGLDAVEERARSELGLIRDGEEFYLIVSPDDVDPESLPESNSDAEADPTP